MRKYFMTAFVLAATFVFADTGLALEKTAARFDDQVDSWSAGSTCSVLYYNTCTGWIWIWSGWEPEDKIGMCFDSCCGAGLLVLSAHRTWWGSPSGYGFTGTIAVEDVLDCCLYGQLACQSFLPMTGWNTYFWGIPAPATFAIVATIGDTPLENPVAFATDHPAAGPTGPAACGNCYPSTRTNHTFYYGYNFTALCPGSPLNDGVCDAQLFYVATMSCPKSVDESTFGQIKGLYR